MAAERRRIDAGQGSPRAPARWCGLIDHLPRGAPVMPSTARPSLPPVLQHGFRPFFFLGALWAALALFLWLGSLAGAVTLPTAMDPAAWHRHEMLFGYLGAIVAA